jgi:hypothetical protein
MDPKSLTDEIIGTLLKAPKYIKNTRAKETPKEKHRERNYEVLTLDGGHTFTLIVRQSTMVLDSFTCGLLWHAGPGQKVMLTRYNGSDHEHANPLEGEQFDSMCHIHLATQRYIQLGRKAEVYATPTDRYRTVDDALRCLCEDCNISGLFESNASEDDRQWGLFS